MKMLQLLQETWDSIVNDEYINGIMDASLKSSLILPKEKYPMEADAIVNMAMVTMLATMHISLLFTTHQEYKIFKKRVYNARYLSMILLSYLAVLGTSILIFIIVMNLVLHLLFLLFETVIFTCFIIYVYYIEMEHRNKEEKENTKPVEIEIEQVKAAD